MKLTQDYINQKHEELNGRLDEYLVRVIIERLQYRLEMKRIEDELSSDGTEKHTMPTSETS